ncbi:MAG: hypothetical protein H8D87_13140 [Deltaproteobacteria bacterium]|uniref:hypothetical protein n=1 Tax=Desulfobacula sp. TaxID=2593537 RepID=UPI0019B39837|nr:hypothetical protein [Candidatus Desulfobacula maris]MBL6992727.1 hypothetical protein [Desulfobacula sp.]
MRRHTIWVGPWPKSERQYLLHTFTADMGDAVKNHQEKLEQAYLKNDIWFN